MKIDAKIKWLIDEPQIGIEVDKLEIVKVDTDYVEAFTNEITNWIEDELERKYQHSFRVTDDDFTICNMSKLLEEIRYSEFEDKTDPGYEE